MVNETQDNYFRSAEGYFVATALHRASAPDFDPWCLIEIVPEGNNYKIHYIRALTMMEMVRIKSLHLVWTMKLGSEPWGLLKGRPSEYGMPKFSVVRSYDCVSALTLGV